jgi:4-amino-4-deoxychorismate lyase
VKALVNGRLADPRDAVISIYDHGFLYGIGLFETFRTYGGRPWLLDRHAERLAEGCAELGIRYAPDPAAMEAEVRRLLEANGLDDGYVRWSVSAGEGAVGLPAGDYERPNVVVYAKALPPDEPASRPGKTVRRLRLRRSGPEGTRRFKSFPYMNNVIAKRELIRAGAAPGTEGIFLNGEGKLVEGLVSNVFWLRGGKLYTPAEETGLLPGVTRRYVLELAGRLGLDVEEGLYEWEDLLAAEEAFLTNSVQEIVPVVRIEDELGQGFAPGGRAEAGPVTARLMEAYRRAAERGGAAE